MAHLEEVQGVRLDLQRDTELLQDLLRDLVAVLAPQEITVLPQLLLVTLGHPALATVLPAQEVVSVVNRVVDIEEEVVVVLEEVLQLQVTMPLQDLLHLVNMVPPLLEAQEDLTEVLVELKEDTVEDKEVVQEDSTVVVLQEDMLVVMEVVLEVLEELEDMDKKKTTHQCHTTLPMPSRTTTETTTTVKKLAMDKLSMVNTEFCFPMVVLKLLLTLLTGRTVSMPK